MKSEAVDLDLEASMDAATLGRYRQRFYARSIPATPATSSIMRTSWNIGHWPSLLTANSGQRGPRFCCSAAARIADDHAAPFGRLPLGGLSLGCAPSGAALARSSGLRRQPVDVHGSSCRSLRPEHHQAVCDRDAEHGAPGTPRGFHLVPRGGYQPIDTSGF